MPGPLEHLAMLARRARFYFNRERFERELAEEMRFHIDMKARDHEHAGMSADAARYAAHRRVGNAARIQEQTGDVMAVGWLDAALQDARYALRSLRKSPAFSVVAIASQALGIGATTAVFTLVIRQGAVLTAIGLVLGVAGAFAATGLLSSFLFGVARVDVFTYSVTIVLVGLTGMLAAWVPALRATRVDPVIALRD